MNSSALLETVQDISRVPISLTELEVKGLKTMHNFADGHAANDDNLVVNQVVAELPFLWDQARNISSPEMERYFKYAYAELIQSETLKEYPYFSICPTASSSIDIVAAFLRAKSYKVALLEPAFDNLYLLLKRREVPVTSMDELYLRQIDLLEEFVQEHSLDALFLITPNNPTGWVIDQASFQKIIEICERHGITLILDTTFRLFIERTYDDYALLVESGIDFIVIEDTGKVWPTQEQKASLLSYSASIAKFLREIYEEVFLCVSNVTLLLLQSIFEKAKKVGLYEAVRKPLQERRKQFRDTLQGSFLEIDHQSIQSQISVEWIQITKTGKCDLEILDFFAKNELAFLPGRLFYWSEPTAGRFFIRASLLKPKNRFESGLQALKQVIQNKEMEFCHE